MQAKTLQAHLELKLETYRRELDAAGTDPEMAQYILGLLEQILFLGQECEQRGQDCDRKDVEIATLQQQLLVAESFANHDMAPRRQSLGLVTIGLLVGLLIGLFL
jgi:hypothetical protein